MTDFQPTPQTPEQVDEGLRDAMKQAKIEGVFDWSTAQIHQPKVICNCDLFGQGQLVITFTDVGYGVRPVPNRWIRFWTRVFFNSKWKFVND
jgi:hypothetical protein